MSRRPGRGGRGARPAARWWFSSVCAAGLAGLLVTSVGAGESLYSLQFLGVSTETGDVRARGMGVLGVGLDDPQTAITLNPASPAALRRMTLSLMSVASVRTSSDRTMEERGSDVSFPQLRAALPLSRQLVFSVGVLGLRSYHSEFALPPATVAGFEYRQSFERQGGLYEFPFGLATAVGDRVHLGATLDLLLGTVDESWVTRGDSLLALRTRRRDGFFGTSVTLGFVAYPHRSVRLGATWSPNVDLDRETRTVIEDARSGVVATVRDATVKSDVCFPGTLRGGAALQIGPHWLLCGDYLRRDWGSYDGRSYGAESVGVETRSGGGLEFRPRGVGAARGSAFRAGFSYATWPQQLGGDPLREATVHAGAGIDLLQGLGRLDVAVEYARAGDLARNGHEENRWSLLVGLTGQEVWRRKSPRTK